jgi:hypothetical protein
MHLYIYKGWMYKKGSAAGGCRVQIKYYFSIYLNYPHPIFIQIIYLKNKIIKEKKNLIFIKY